MKILLCFDMQGKVNPAVYTGDWQVKGRKPNKLLLICASFLWLELVLKYMRTHIFNFYSYIIKENIQPLKIPASLFGWEAIDLIFDSQRKHRREMLSIPACCLAQENFHRKKIGMGKLPFFIVETPLTLISWGTDRLEKKRELAF